jgi:hypothetical protein
LLLVKEDDRGDVGFTFQKIMRLRLECDADWSGVTNTKIRFNPQLAWREIEGHVIVISPHQSMIHELNDTATFIWKLIESGRELQGIARLFAEEYGLDWEIARADLAEFVTLLGERDLILPQAMSANA